MMNGHGWVTPRPDGMKARCGGPAICSQCALELAQVKSPIVAEWMQSLPGPVPQELNRILLAAGKSDWLYDRDTNLYLPYCSASRLAGSEVIRCGHGPLTGVEIKKGACTKYVHIARHEPARNEGPAADSR
jgi:hypothetical protein